MNAFNRIVYRIQLLSTLESIISMTKYMTLKIPLYFADIIDSLVASGEFSSRADYVKALIRADLKSRGLLGV